MSEGKEKSAIKEISESLKTLSQGYDDCRREMEEMSKGTESVVQGIIDITASSLGMIDAFDTIGGTISKLGKKLKTNFGDDKIVSNFVKSAKTSISEFGSSISGLGKKFKDFGNNIKGVFSNAKDNLSNLAKSAKGSLSKVGSALSSGLGSALGTIGDGFKSFGAKAKDIFSGNYSVKR